jgi:hypothetical protein
MPPECFVGLGPAFLYVMDEGGVAGLAADKHIIRFGCSGWKKCDPKKFVIILLIYWNEIGLILLENLIFVENSNIRDCRILFNVTVAEF